MLGKDLKSALIGPSRRLFCIWLSLAPALSSCQTSGSGAKAESLTPGKPRDAAAQIYSNQKQVAKNALDTGRADQAVQQLRILLRSHPKDAELHTLMGFARLTLKNAPRAVKDFQTAAKLDPSIANGLNLSSAYIEAGDNERAVELLKKLNVRAAEEDYEFKERILHNLGYAHVKLKRYANAERWLKMALEENPAFFPSHLELGRLYQVTKRPALSMRSYRTAIDYCHQCYEPVQSLTSLYMAAGRYAEARDVLLGYMRQENLPAKDREQANKLLRMATTAGLPKNNKG
jgi:tetratricopeptide (TPR) repeat protein